MNMRGKYILLINKTDDRKVRYVTAKKLAVMFRDRKFSEWKSQLDTGSTVVTRSDSLAHLEACKESLELTGAVLGIRDQARIGGKKVF